MGFHTTGIHWLSLAARIRFKSLLAYKAEKQPSHSDFKATHPTLDHNFSDHLPLLDWFCHLSGYMEDMHQDYSLSNSHVVDFNSKVSEHLRHRHYVMSKVGLLDYGKNHNYIYLGQ